jgi:hypothetical protein
MLRFLLTGFCCLYAFICFSQDGMAVQSTDTIQPSLVPDSNLIVESLDAVVRDNARVFISWKSANARVDYYTIERSCGGRDFETIAVLKRTNGQVAMDWVDEQPVRGKNLYRIRCVDADGVQRYSHTVSLMVGGNISLRFYPNPADNMLIVRSEQPVDFTIADANGKTRIFQSQLSGLQLINVSSLEKGVYIVRIYNRQLNSLVQEKLVKN